MATLLVPPRANAGLLRLAAALLGGSAGGTLAATAFARVTGGKRGTAMQLLAVAAFGAAGALRLLLGGGLDVATRDAAGPLAVIVASVVAWGRLR